MRNQNQAMSTRKAALIILDGWGHGKRKEASAISAASTPYVDALYNEASHAELITYGEEVGLPAEQMGNSEVGHLNIGAGRVVYQDFAKVNKAIRDEKMEPNPVFQDLIAYAKEKNRPVHLMGLFSDGGVHSHIDHLIELCRLVHENGLESRVHAFLDGRDTAPDGGSKYLDYFLEKTADYNTRIASCIGRYYSMDRDNRWERIKQAYDLITKGLGESTDDLKQTIESYYKQGITDEFMPAIIADVDGVINEDDPVLFFNFRTDRPRQLTIALTQNDFPEYKMFAYRLFYCTMTEYSKAFDGVHVLFRKEDLTMTIGEVVSKAGLTQVRIAETEKYPHVTFFFSGGREEPFEGEERLLIKSPNVATYDLKPEMSAYEVTDALVTHVREKSPDFICINYANADMVGHTGDFKAAQLSAETVDKCLVKLNEELDRQDYAVIIIADHGNADIMINEDGTPHTAHTTNMVPIFLRNAAGKTVRNGKLADVAPSLLSLMGVSIPEEMTGDVIIRD